MKRLLPVGTIILIILSTLSCSLIPQSRDQVKKAWSIDRSGLKALIADTNQVKSESDRLLQTIDRLEFPKSGGIKVLGTCWLADGATQAGDFKIALINQDSRVRMEISVVNLCGIQQDDPRVAVMNNELSNALGEKIAADCGKVLVDWIDLSGDRLTVWYVKSS
jgi:hypothetical protein